MPRYPCRWVLVCCRPGQVPGSGFAANVKPMMVADRGWYHDSLFVPWTLTRQEYLDNLARGLWFNFGLTETRQRAEIFPGWYFGFPSWSSDIIMRDELFGVDFYQDIPNLLKADVERDVATKRSWFTSTARRYNTFKMVEAETFVVLDV